MTLAGLVGRQVLDDEVLSDGSKDESELDEDSSDELDIDRSKGNYTLWQHKGGLIDDIYYNMQEAPDTKLTKVKKFFGFK